MLEKGKISAVQMGFLIFPVIVSTGDLVLPGVTSQHAGRDMWMTPILSSSIGFLMVYVLCRLNRLYPDQTPIEYSQKIIGRIPGKTIGLLTLFYLLYLNAIILREYADFLIGTFFTNTPFTVIALQMVLLSAFAVYGGLEVMARAAQVFVPFIVVLFLMFIVLLIPDMEPEEMFPVLENGAGPAFRGTIDFIVWYSHFMLIAFFLPHLKDKQQGLKWGMISVLVSMLILVLIHFSCLFVLGNLNSSLLYPLFNAIRYISVADFLEHLEVSYMAIWMVGAFLKISVYYYALALGTAQWSGLSDYRPVILPLGFLLTIFSIWIADSLQEVIHLITTVVFFYVLTFEVLVPIFLLMIARIRGQRPKREGAEKK